MEIRIEWSEKAERQLKDIFDYYSLEISSIVARKIINNITDRVSILEYNPLSGQKEQLLSEYKEDFRYLVESNYKVIYWKHENQITIASVFDCRQNPEKIRQI